MNDQVTPTASRGLPAGGGSEAGDGGLPQAAGQPYLHDLISAVGAPAMALSGPDGQIRPGGAQGIYVNDVRAISELVLTVGGQQPVPLGHDRQGGHVSRFHSVIRMGQPEVDPRLFVTRERRLEGHGAVETFTFKSYAPPQFVRRLELKLSCDLAGIGAVKAGAPSPAQPAAPVDKGLAWSLPGWCSVRAVAHPAPDDVDPGSGLLGWDLSLAPGQAFTISLSLQLHEQTGKPSALVPAPRRGAAPQLRVSASDERLNRFVQASLADLEQLRMATAAAPEDAFLAAGSPWYLTLFGRDSIWAARMLLPLGTDLALGTLRTLARFQGQAVDSRTGEQPGKILHELRRESPPLGATGGGAAGGGIAGLPPVYYGTVDATPLWVCLLHDAWRWGAPRPEVEALLGPMQACLQWMAEYGAGPDGFVSYIDESGTGLANQGWKDSYDSVQFRDGRLARAPLALCEVQGYCYEAAMAGAALLDAFGLPGAGRWRDFASGMAERFRQRFWLEDAEGPYPAIALDADGVPVDSVSSNMGHLLGTGILDREEAEVISRRLLGPDLSSGFGLRTLAASSAGYNPLSYHCGSVWGHDTAIAITGLARYGSAVAREAAAQMIDGLVEAAEAFGYQMPELYGGHQKQPAAIPLPYPAACHPQAWTAASSVAVLAALAGAWPDVPGGTVVLSPVPSGAGLRQVEGFVVGGRRARVDVDESGRARLEGVDLRVEGAGRR